MEVLCYHFSVYLQTVTVFRCNLEVELVQRNDSPCSPLPSLVSKKSCLCEYNKYKMKVKLFHFKHSESMKIM